MYRSQYHGRVKAYRSYTKGRKTLVGRGRRSLYIGTKLAGHKKIGTLSPSKMLRHTGTYMPGQPNNNLATATSQSGRFVRFESVS